MAGKKQPWEQRDNEPDVAFKRFLFYLHLGPNRTIRKAWQASLPVDKRSKTHKQPPGNWMGDSAVWKWVERADRYDIYNMARHGRKAMIRHMQAVAELAKKTLKGFREHDAADFEQAVKGFDALGKQITAETVEAFRDMGSDEPESEDDEAEQRPIPLPE